MIEMMAMKLHDEWNGVGRWSSLSDAGRRRWKFMALAALEGMRIPTEGMIRVGSQAGPWTVDRYMAMIEDAISEAKEVTK